MRRQNWLKSASTGDDNGPSRRRWGYGNYGSGRQLPGSYGAAYTVAVPGFGSMAVCVRTCDGSFFPVGQFLSASLDPQESLCKALCPNAEAELYLIPPWADGIAGAVSRNGHPYSKMPNALLYTKKRVEACTCHGNDSQARLVSMVKDFTMRRGDAVMTPNGVQVFLGAFQWPYNQSNFQVLDKAKYILPNGLALAEVEKATKPLVEPSPKPAVDGNDDADGPDDDEPIFVTDQNGKKVRLIGDLQMFGNNAPRRYVEAPTTATDAGPELADGGTTSMPASGIVPLGGLPPGLVSGSPGSVPLSELPPIGQTRLASGPPAPTSVPATIVPLGGLRTADRVDGNAAAATSTPARSPTASTAPAPRLLAAPLQVQASRLVPLGGVGSVPPTANGEVGAPRLAHTKVLDVLPMASNAKAAASMALQNTAAAPRTDIVPVLLPGKGP